ncbi:PREDICTED: uncharacterized protein LOC107185710 [Dufourea novaeangliae]|uniref:Platelet-derived growth factor (PDGF) family profile domain-containing protein n=1 Tax=Dufourea novaeangliae TaxID=178035 RepID=A0A154P6E1_DUFNO|nr:PREDICTED: uncharacterized protein LOC107185710 [Dufourea novaeangliae]KZC07393.1 hypothetical protein WN55_09385 [Dufourea novaeangliae]
MRNRLSKSSLLKLLIIVPLTLDNIVLSMANPDGHHHHRRTARKIHLPRAIDASRKFVCREPQTRAYNLRDLMQNVQQNPGESAIQPVYIILKRCDGHSGCCMSPDKSCSPVDTSIYYEEMEIEIWSLETNGTRRQWIKVEQHGKCACEVNTSDDRNLLDYQQPNVTLI